MQNISSTDLTLMSYKTPSSACWKAYLRPSNTFSYLGILNSCHSPILRTGIVYYVHILYIHSCSTEKKVSQTKGSAHLSYNLLYSCSPLSEDKLSALGCNHHCTANINNQVRTPSSPWGYFYFITCLVYCSSFICFPNKCSSLLATMKLLQFYPAPAKHPFLWMVTDRSLLAWPTTPLCLCTSSLILTRDPLPNTQEIKRKTASSQTSALYSSWSGNQLAHRAVSQQEAPESRAGSGRRRIY